MSLVSDNARTCFEWFWARLDGKVTLKIFRKCTQTTGASDSAVNDAQYATQKTTNRNTVFFYPMESCVGCQHAAAF